MPDCFKAAAARLSLDDRPSSYFIPVGSVYSSALETGIFAECGYVRVDRATLERPLPADRCSPQDVRFRPKEASSHSRQSRAHSHNNNVSLTRAADLTVRFPSRISPKTHSWTRRSGSHRIGIERVDQDVDVCEFKTGLPSGQAKRRCHPDPRLAKYRRRHGTPAVKPRVARSVYAGGAGRA